MPIPFSRQLNDNIHISGPYGRLKYLGAATFQIKDGDNLQTRTYSKVVMIAGGTGITPMYQIIQAMVEEKLEGMSLHLLFANKTEVGG